MDEYITKGIAQKIIETAATKHDALMMIDGIPAADIIPVRHGRWIDCDTQCGISCSVCGTPVDDFFHSIDYIDLEYKPNYCPHCGARMDGEQA